MGTMPVIELTPSSELPMDLLMLADPSEEIIRSYLKNSQGLVVRLGKEVMGGMILYQGPRDNWEIKNLAVYKEFQRRGIARKLLVKGIAYGAESGIKTLSIATGNSSIHQLKLYQQVGFEIVALDKDYFVHNYPDPIWENGIHCKHRFRLQIKYEI